MLVLCHRGYHINAPENTIEAFKAAIERGVDGIETDIRLSADGIPILFHDRFVIDGREVSSLSHAELSKAVGYSVPARSRLRFGKIFPDFRAAHGLERSDCRAVRADPGA